MRLLYLISMYVLISMHVHSKETWHPDSLTNAEKSLLLVSVHRCTQGHVRACWNLHSQSPEPITLFLERICMRTIHFIPSYMDVNNPQFTSLQMNLFFEKTCIFESNAHIQKKYTYRHPKVCFFFHDRDLSFVCNSTRILTPERPVPGNLGHHTVNPDSILEEVWARTNPRVRTQIHGMMSHTMSLVATLLYAYMPCSQSRFQRSSAFRHISGIPD